MRRSARRWHIALLSAVLIACACGRKTDPRPPELVAPRPVGEFALNSRAEGVELRWARPTQYVDGSTMEDLAGFVVERSRENQAFSELARVVVGDRGRFHRAKRFEYLDRAVAQGTTYHYRIVAFTTDGYYSVASGAGTITWSPPPPSPAPSRSPVEAP